MSKDILKVEVEQVERMLEINRLTPDNTTFKETSGGFVTATVNETDYGIVNIIRTFPLSDENKYLSVRLSNKKQDEIGIIEELTDFDSQTQQILLKQLKLRYFMPKIVKIISIKEEFGYSYWNVLTDKGEFKFSSSSGSSGVVIPYKKGVIIKDTNENRYVIEDLSKLSATEMKKIDLYL